MRNKTKRQLSYWIKTRFNPQLGTYHVAMGQMTVKDANGYGSSLYGSNHMTRYRDKESYEARIEELKTAGEQVQ